MDRRSALKAAAGMLFAKTAFGQRILQQELTKPEYSAAMQRLQQEAKELSDIFTQRTGKEYKFEISFGLRRSPPNTYQTMILRNTGADRYEYAFPIQSEDSSIEQKKNIAEGTLVDLEVFLHLAETRISRTMPEREYVVNTRSQDHATMIQNPVLGRDDYEVAEILNAGIPYATPAKNLADLAKFDARYNGIEGKGRQFSNIHYCIANRNGTLANEAMLVNIFQSSASAEFSYPFFPQLLSPSSEQQHIVAEAMTNKLTRTFSAEQLPTDMQNSDTIAFRRSFIAPRTAYLSSIIINKQSGMTQYANYAIPDAQANSGYYSMMRERKNGRLVVTGFSDIHLIA